MNHKIMMLAFAFCAATIALSQSASAIHAGPAPISLPTVTGTLYVKSADMDGNRFPGQWVEVWQNDEIIDEGFTPFATSVELLSEYQVYIYDDPNEGKFFDHWEDGSTDQMRTITPLLLSTKLVGFFQVNPPQNSPPEAGDDFAETTMNTEVTVDVLANDIDQDGDALFVDSIVIQPENGDAIINEDGTITYVPFADFVGTDTFDYQVADGNGGTDTALVTVTVNG